MSCARSSSYNIIRKLHIAAVVATPTAILFYRDRRRIPPNHCQRCSYNLTGNVSGRCPECGTPCNTEGDKV